METGTRILPNTSPELTLKTQGMYRSAWVVPALPTACGEVSWYENLRGPAEVVASPSCAKHTIESGGSRPYVAALENLDGDAELELVVNSGTGVRWYDPPADRRMPWPGVEIDSGFGTSEPSGLFTGDLNRDGLVDVAVCDNAQAELRWYCRAGGGWSAQTVQSDYPGINDLSGGDLDGRDVALQFNLRNECSDAFSGPWTDEAVTIDEAAWTFPFTTLSSPTARYAGQGAAQNTSPGFTGSLRLEQRKGGGTPWQRRARVVVNGVTTESAEAFDNPLIALGGSAFTAAGQLAWMRFREPQALSVDGESLSFQFIGEPLVVGEGKGIWNQARLAILPGTAAAPGIEAVREQGRWSLERGLLVHVPLDHINAAALFPSLGTEAPSTIKSAYVNILDQLHDETVLRGGQWDRAKTFGSQLWPDVQADLYAIDNPSPSANSGAINYWGPAGIEVLEFLRTGDPKRVWDFARQQIWLQLFTAYLNIGEQDHGNRAGLAVNSGGSGEGQWHRSAFGSDDYTYCMGIHLGYVVRPHPAARDRFAQAGRTVVNRYDIPQANQAGRELYVNHVDINRQTVLLS